MYGIIATIANKDHVNERFCMELTDRNLQGKKEKSYFKFVINNSHPRAPTKNLKKYVALAAYFSSGFMFQVVAWHGKFVGKKRKDQS